MNTKMTPGLFPKMMTAISASLLLAAGSLTTQAQPYPTAVLADNPTAYWKLQETSGIIAYDSSAGGTNSGFYTNAVLGQQGYAVGLAAELNYTTPSDTNSSAGFGSAAGYLTDSYVSGMPLDEASSANAAFSVEAWVNNEGSASGAGIVGKGPGGSEEYFLDCGAPGNDYRFYIRNAANTSVAANSTRGSDGNWHHLVGVCDEVHGSIYLYIDGQMVASNAASGGIHSTTNAYMTIGARQQSADGDFNYQFNGDIAQVAVYSYALSAAQVQNHYLAAGIPPTITLQPTNSVAVNAGATITLTSAATGTQPLSYEWTTNGVLIAGQTNADFVLTNVSGSWNSVEVTLVVANAFGTNQSSGTELTVYAGAPQILTDIQPSALTLYQGEPLTYSVVAGGNTPFYYQWFQNGSSIPGATNSSYTVDTPSGTNTYFVNVSNTYNGGSVQPSSTATLIGIALPTGPYPAAIIAANPIAYWRLDEADNGSGNSGSTAYDYVGGHDGTYNQVLLGVPGYSPQDPDTAAEFGTNADPSFASGSNMQEVNNSSQGIPTIDSYLQGPNVSFSVECWAKTASPQNASGSTIIGLGNSGADAFLIDASGPGGVFRYVARETNGNTFGSIYSTISPADGNWHHLVAAFSETGSGSTTFYVDGNLAGTLGAPSGAGLYSTTAPLYIGGDNAYQFNGTIDEVSIYNYGLSAGQVQAHYQAAPEPPVFEVLPPSVATSFVGGSVTLSATELGSLPLTNQWYSNSVRLVGQTNVSLTLNNLPAGTNIFTLWVTNAYGVTNTPGTSVQVAAGAGPPVIVANVSPQAEFLYSGEAASYSVAVTGSGPFHYQWYSNSLAVSGATASGYIITNLVANDAGSYFVTVSNQFSNVVSSTSVLGVVAAPTNPYALTVMHDHPISYWRLDEANGSTTGFDYVGGGIGIYSNTAGIKHVPGIFGTGFDADFAANFNTNGTYTKQVSGSSNYLGTTFTNYDLSVPNGQNGEFSVEAWVNADPTIIQSSGGGIVAKGYGNGGEEFNLDAHAGYRFYARTSTGALTASAQASGLVAGNGGSTSTWQGDGNWHHLVGVCDEANDNLLLYVDGNLIGYPVISNGVVPATAYIYQTNHNGSTGTNGLLSATPGGGYGLFAATNYTTGNAAAWGYNSVSIGARNSGSGTAGLTLGFKGGVDEVALYNYCLTPLQVSNHFATAMNLPVTLSANVTNGVTTVTWFGNFATGTLQSSTNLAGPWTSIPGATSPYTVTNSGPDVFYRVKNF